MFRINPGRITLGEIDAIIRNPNIQVGLMSSAWTQIDRANAAVERMLLDGIPVYGVTTGFGANARIPIPISQHKELQRRLIVSHCAGVGDFMPDAVVRLMLVLRVNSLAQGHSGVSRRLIETALMLLKKKAYPCIPWKGSVGASGDLVPLAHMAAALIGEGRIRVDGRVVAARAALRKLEISEYELGPKEGLALINGCTASAAIALVALLEMQHLFAAAVVAGALSVEAVFGSASPYDDRVHLVRRHHGQRKVAGILRALLAGGERRSPKYHVRLQDPYSLRCQPQVMGACFAQMDHAASVLVDEANAVTDNPLLFQSDDGFDVVNGGNFHGEPIAMAADNLALAASEIGALSERRIALLIDGHHSGLAHFLAATPGLDCGFMIPHVSAVSLASENKSLAHPASIDSLPTSANQEDHVSMSTFAARRLLDMCANTSRIVAIELMAACQGIDLRSEVPISAPLKAARDKVRESCAFLSKDRILGDEIDELAAKLRSGMLAEYLGNGFWEEEPGRDSSTELTRAE